MLSDVVVSNPTRASLTLGAHCSRPGTWPDSQAVLSNVQACGLTVMVFALQAAGIRPLASKAVAEQT